MRSPKRVRQSVAGYAAGVLAVSLCAGAAHASYVTSFDTDVSGDFGFAEIGQLGTAAASGNAITSFEEGYLRLAGRYAVDTSQVLLKSGSTATVSSVDYEGVYSDTYARMTFTYYGIAPQTTSAGMGIRLPKPNGANNYGYVVRLNGTNHDADVNFELIEWNSFNNLSLVDFHQFTGENSLTAGDTEYQLDFSAVNDGLGNALITATLYTGDVELARLEYIDTSPKTAGWVGMFAGQVAVNNTTYQGINVTGFSVGSTGFVAIPEPAAMSLLGIGAVGLLRRKRRK